MKNLVKILWLVALPLISVGHPGHGHDNPLSPGHYLGNPVHSIPIVLTLAVAAVFIVWKVVRARNDAKK